MHCGDAEALAIIDKQVTEFCLTEAARVGQNSLKDGLKVAWRTGDRPEYLRGRRLLLQRLGKVPPHLGELTGARFELLFQLAQRIEPVANARFRVRSGRTKLAGARWTTCTFARQGHLVGTVTGPPLRPSPLSDGPRVLFSLRSGELIQGFSMQDPNLSQVSLRFFNVVLYGVQLFPDCNLTSMIQRGFKAIDAKCSISGKGISLLYFVAG